MGNRAHIIFDGYNCILRLRQVDRNDPEALEKARENLLADVAAYKGNRRINVTVVFDGTDLISSAIASNPAGIKVLFSKPPKNADRLILDKIESVPVPDSITVVSSDNFVRSSAAAMGCRTLSAEQFYQKLHHKKENQLGEKYSGEISEADLDEWMNIFSKEKPDE